MHDSGATHETYANYYMTSLFTEALRSRHLGTTTTQLPQVISASMVNLPLEILPARQTEFNNFVGKFSVFHFHENTILATLPLK